MTDILQITRANALRALIPPPKTDLRTWLESTVNLPSDVSATSGRIKLWPYQVGIADAISDPNIERVTLVKSVRIGLSTLITGTIANYVANEPSPILMLLPTEADCRDYAVSDLEPIFEATPDLRGLLSEDAEQRNTILSRRFSGGSLKIVAAKSPRNLRRHNVRILLVDEADAMEITKEGDPIALAEKRTLSFGNRKIILGSTPVDDETSNVLRAYRKSDQRIFEVPCPECDTFFQIQWKDITWPQDEPEKAFCTCPDCGGVIEEHKKAAMTQRGRWRATKPHIKGHAGFQINALVSTLPNATWAKLAAEFLEAKKSPDTLQTFVNTILGEGWKEAGDEIDESELKSRAEPFSLESIPTEVKVLTAGVDVQHDRLECTILGWTQDDTMLTLAHIVIYGDIQNDETPWQELDALLAAKYPHPLGGEIGLAATAIDSGDGNTMDAVHAFTRPRYSRRIISIKGDDGPRLLIDKSNSKTNLLWIVGVDTAKSHIFKKLETRGLIRFSNTLPEVWYDQFASERRVVRYYKGRPKAQWERIKGKRAEALDCFVYAYAVRGLVNANYTKIENQLRAVTPQAPAKSAIVRSSWMMKVGKYRA